MAPTRGMGRDLVNVVQGRRQLVKFIKHEFGDE
jgi:hypothetical protein